MILRSSTGYWSTGIILRWTSHSGSIAGVSHSGWGGRVEFHDDGFAGDDNPDTGAVSTEGRLHSRYFIRDGDVVTGLRAVIDVLLSDAQRLGITFGGAVGAPSLYYDGDSENEALPPPDGWREMLAAEAERIGWACPYARQPGTVRAES